MVKKRYLPAVSKASPRVRSPLAWVNVLKGPRKVRLWLGLSLADMGREVARLAERERVYDRRTVFGWERGKPMGQIERDAYGIQVANKLSAELGRIVGVKLIANSPWHVTAWTACRKCGSWFELHRSRDIHCPECRQR